MDLSRIGVVGLALGGIAVIFGLRLLLAHWFSRALATGRVSRERVAVLRFGDVSGVDERALRSFNVVCSAHVGAADSVLLTDALQAFVSEAAASSARRVFILAPFQALTQLEKITSALRKLPISAMLLTEDWAARSLSRPVALDPRLTAFEMQAPPLDLAERAAKRGMDIFVSALSLFFLSPFMLAIAIAVRLEGPGPILFHQWRLGFNGRKFQIVKFRSMTVTEDGASITQVRRDDARVTRVGAFLRARSLDEIPQLINVLRGDMSLVGPRPHAVAHDNYYDDLIADYSMRRHMKPGLTGWAQVSGLRGETPTVARMATRVDHNLWYIGHWSLWLDFWILLKTIPEVVRARDVY